MKLFATTLCTLGALASFAGAASPPPAYGPTPTSQQVDWLRMEWYAFVHFGLNTYTNREWGYGDESPAQFNPVAFDAKKITSVFKEAGMTGMIYTAKHHDGWCAWPTKSTEHNIRKAAWKNGKGDVVREFADACKASGIKFGTYLSPWDRNCAEYGRPGYLRVYYKQIEELLTQYGDIFEIWFDGAMGGDGYYGGAKENRNIGEADKYYDYAEVVRRIRRLQPDCIIWGASGRGDAVWGGSEKGFVAYPLWNTQNNKWISLEGDTPINHRGWFWHPGQKNAVKDPQTLMKVYLSSVGLGANLILNLAPDRNGRLDQADVDSLLAFGAARRELLSKDYALGAAAKASEVRGKDKRFNAAKLTDGNIESYWCPNDGTTSGSVEIKLEREATFDVIRLREQIRLGQRVEAFSVDAWVDGKWKTIVEAGNPGEKERGLDAVRGGKGHTIGHQVMRWLNEPVTTRRIRLNIVRAKACPCISELSLLRMPEILPKSAIRPQGNGQYTLETHADCTTHYTLDGSTPRSSSPVYKEGSAINFQGPGQIKACYINNKTGNSGPAGTLNVGYPRQAKGDAAAACDDNPDTFWHSATRPATIELDLGSKREIASFSYLPRQDGKVQDMTDRYLLELSNDGKQWKNVAEGEFSNLRANPVELEVAITPQQARFARLTATRALEGKGCSVAELKFYPPQKEEADSDSEKTKKNRRKSKKSRNHR